MFLPRWSAPTLSLILACALIDGLARPAAAEEPLASTAQAIAPRQSAPVGATEEPQESSPTQATEPQESAPTQVTEPRESVPVQVAAPEEQASVGTLRTRLEALVGQAKPKVADHGLASVAVLDAFYRGRDDRPAWQRQAQVEALQRAIELSPEDGLDPADFQHQALVSVLGGKAIADLTGSARDDAELLLSDSLLRYLHHRLFGKVDPVAINHKRNGADPATLEVLVSQLDAALAAPDLSDHLAHLVREPVFYTRLKEGLAHYRKVAANGGWKTIPAGGKLALGARDQRVVALRERLRASGEYGIAGSADSKVFDRALHEAVKVFQKSAGLAVDGVAGASTLAALNVSADQRVDQIRVNLERMRWVYRDLPEDYLLVDVAVFQVNLMQGGEVAWSTKAQVGREDRQTPTFRDRLEYLELNPTWTVPPTILKDDILPKARVNPAYVAKKGLKAIDRNGRSVPLSAVNWNLPAGSFPYSLRQDGGGAKAALGKIKFMFPNRFSVYLHDTPSRHLFNLPVRMTSSGCVRVDKPFELAERVLRQPEHWDQAKLQQVVDKGKTRSVKLKEPLDVILAYWTAEGLGDGQVRFRSDIYGRDPAILAALDGDRPMTVKLPPEPEPEPEPSPDDPPEPTAPIKVEMAPAPQTPTTEAASHGRIGGAQALAGM